MKNEPKSKQEQNQPDTLEHKAGVTTAEGGKSADPEKEGGKSKKGIGVLEILGGIGAGIVTLFSGLIISNAALLKSQKLGVRKVNHTTGQSIDIDATSTKTAMEIASQFTIYNPVGTTKLVFSQSKAAIGATVAATALAAAGVGWLINKFRNKKQESFVEKYQQEKAENQAAIPSKG